MVAPRAPHAVEHVHTAACVEEPCASLYATDEQPLRFRQRRRPVLLATSAVVAASLATGAWLAVSASDENTVDVVEAVVSE